VCENIGLVNVLANSSADSEKVSLNLYTTHELRHVDKVTCMFVFPYESHDRVMKYVRFGVVTIIS
jgi:hypothetical protein